MLPLVCQVHCALKWNVTFSWSHVCSEGRPSQTPPHHNRMSLRQRAVAMAPSRTTVCAIISIALVYGDGQVWDESDVHMVLPASRAHCAQIMTVITFMLVLGPQSKSFSDFSIFLFQESWESKRIGTCCACKYCHFFVSENDELYENTNIPQADDFNSLMKNRLSTLNRRLNGSWSRGASYHSDFIFGSEIMFQVSKHQT